MTPEDVQAIAAAVAQAVRQDQFTIIEGSDKGKKIAAQTAIRDVLAGVTALRRHFGA